MDVKIAMQSAGIRIARSLAVFEMRDCSPTVNDRYAPASGRSCGAGFERLGFGALGASEGTQIAD
jgi:hypothetical protein